MVRLIARKLDERRKAHRQEAAIQFAASRIPNVKKVTGRGVYRERLLGLRKTDKAEFLTQVNDSVRAVDLNVRDDSLNASSHSSCLQHQEGERYPIGQLNSEIAVAYDALSDVDKAKLEEEAQAINAAEEAVAEEIKSSEEESKLRRVV